ncbi:hypothetical protein EVB81_066 [Rhizobium phage RHph_I46]|uniref:Uncharacterized protein n=1 Tax=Rhizobium phage RHph_I1_9 TaxID=2509729 RepID=A0A7S5R9C1_9CAUD|nr:hypothetical protein PP936_gp065 [Rhizobium phage RHph_I1_9]QIG69635.1 hypothetical protein EVB81_066 [Rhizobium phage RHph_I46]QIG70916.1 hypothetical protein EVB92_066 [Rhizobium phage RHph_I9]QIG73502.1 hypothetical protein EVC04_065 [Rhizobium phage RHph_I1_9]QIG76255.1 hypothetical protein EVC25_066 [Rhizobium phage RHph_I34]
MITKDKVHYKDKLGNNLCENEVFVHEDGRCYARVGNGMTSPRHVNGKTMFVNGDRKIFWFLPSEMTPFEL